MHSFTFTFNTKNIDFKIKKKTQLKNFRKKQLKKEAGVPQFYRTSQYRQLCEGRKTFASVAELVSLNSNNLFIRKYTLTTFQQQKLPYKIA